MPPGLRTCLPCGCPASVGSQTETTISWLPEAFKAAVISIAEGTVSAGVLAGFLAVHMHHAVPIHRAEVEQHALALPRLGNLDAALVPDALFGFHDMRHSRQCRFHRIGNQDFLTERGRARVFLFRNCKFPQAIEVEPVLAHHLWPWILRQRVVGSDLLGPLGHDMSGHRCPLRSLSGGPGGQGQQEAKASGQPFAWQDEGSGDAVHGGKWG